MEFQNKWRKTDRTETRKKKPTALVECQHSSVGGTTRRRKSARIQIWTIRKKLSNTENWNLWTCHPNCNRIYMLSIIHRVFKKIDQIIIIQPLKKLNSYLKTFLKNIQAQPVPLKNLLCKGGKSSEPLRHLFNSQRNLTFKQSSWKKKQQAMLLSLFN